MIGTWPLVRLVLRRDRIILPLWVVLLAVLPVFYASATAELFPTDAARQAYYDSIVANPTLSALLGPVTGPSLGALTAWRSGVMFVLIGLASLLTVIRHTRAEEEAGRRELLGSTVVGRYAPLAAALLVTLVANLVLAAIVAAGLVGQGLPAAGSVLLGLSLAGAGWVFASVAAVTAQLSQSATTARGLAVAALGLAYLVRAAGDAGGEHSGLSWLSWLSPIGWLQHSGTFVSERWWVVALAAAFGIALVAVACVVTARRDVDAGALPPRLGPSTAPPALRSPLALAWRLHRGLLLGWTIGFAAIGAVVGGVADSAAEMVDESPGFAEIVERLGGEAAGSDAYISTVMGFLGVAAAGYAVQAALRLRSEEVALRAEPVLATSVGRLRWATSHLAFAALGPAVALVAGGLAAGLAYGLSTGDVGGQVPRMLAGAAVQLPAVWVLAGVAVALFGLVPRLVVGLSWAAVAGCLLVGQLGQVLRLDQWVLDVSPFTHLPRVLGGEVSATPVVALLGVAVALVVVGLAGFRQRDVG